MRIALPKGRLWRQLDQLFKSRDIYFGFVGDRDYRPKSNLANIDAKVLKARDIPQMVALGQFDIGFSCLDAVEEAGFDRLECIPLGISKVRLVASTHHSTPDVLTKPPTRALVAATKYPNLAGRWLAEKGLAHVAVGGAGAIEAYPPENADLIVDIVEVGGSLRANGLIELDTLMRSEACAITHRDTPKKADVEALLLRLTEKEES